MKKIISLFQRNHDGDRLVRDEVVPGAEWVIAGEGTATQKLDGTACLIKSGHLWKRYEVKKKRKVPPIFMPASNMDPVTGKQQGWVPVGNGPEDQYHREAWEDILDYFGLDLPDGTYELVGPKINGNPECFYRHALRRHGAWHLNGPPRRTFEDIKAYLGETAIEGIVWHHKDGRMVKIKAKDFGLKRAGQRILDPR